MASSGGFERGSPWAEVPERYGPPTTCYNRFVRWRKAGVWDRLLEAVSKAYDGDIVMIDSTCVRVHQHAATGKKGWRRWWYGTFPRRAYEQNPRARRCRRSPGQSASDWWTDRRLCRSRRADELGEGDILLADKGYDTNAIRAKAAERKAWANIPPKSNRKGSFVFSRWVYRQRNLVERFFNRIKQFRGIATRYDKRPENYLAAVKLVATRIWCQSL